MWTTTAETVNQSTLRYTVCEQGKRLSMKTFLERLRDDPSFARYFNDVLAKVPFVDFRWEMPMFSRASWNREVEFVVLNSPGLAAAVDAKVFEPLFRESTFNVRATPSLKGDAELVIPRKVGEATSYRHIGAFARGAPSEQQMELWHLVGKRMTELLIGGPRWLSTAGAGVSWLHVRMDIRPKYYHFEPYRTA